MATPRMITDTVQNHALFPWLDVSISDHRILLSALDAARRWPHDPLVLATNDLNLALLARYADVATISLDNAEASKAESAALLAEYRERLAEARTQADDIVTRARKNAEQFESDTQEQSRQRRAELLAQTERDIEAEKRRAIEDIRNEVADLTIAATEKVTGRVLTGDDQRRLVDEALADLDFSSLSGNRSN